MFLNLHSRSGAEIWFDLEALFMSDLRGINLSDENLFELDLGWSNLAGANFSGANLGGANLNFTNFSGANLQGADLRDACINEADLRGANLNEANLSWAKLNRANLEGANLNEANLSWAKLNRANLEGANLNEANLSWAKLCGTSLRYAILPDGIDYYHVKGFPYPVISTPVTVWIGCQSMPVEDWLGEKGRQVAKLHQLSKTEIERCKKILEIIRRKK